MSLLPTSYPGSNGSRTDPLGHPHHTSKSFVMPAMLQNLTRFPSQMPDFELATWQMVNLVVSPRKLYRQVYYHKQTKNTWARDDPAVLILLVSGLGFAGILWGFAYSSGPFGTLWQVVTMVLRDFLLVGVLSATGLWFLSNSFLAAPSSILTTEQKVEWAYAFDVHCNGFFPILLALYYVQLVLKPILLRGNWICLLLGNTLYLAAFGQYWYVTYLGYNALPFLQRTELLLFPVLLLICFYIVSLLGFNCTRHFLSAYFGSV